MDRKESLRNEMDHFKSPLPTPEFYPSNSTSYSTKKSRRKRSFQKGPPPLTAPPACRSYSRYCDQKPHRVSFKFVERLSRANYDESKRESYFKQCFVTETKLGEGSFGKVYKARNKEDNRLYAVKKAKEVFRNESDRAAKLSEVRKHESLPKHPNLVRFIKAWEERGRLYIQTELCKISLSNLCECLHDFPEPLIWKYLVDLLLAVKHLHDHDLVHMDIKPDNIFISADGICKLGDFGLVVDLKKDSLEDVKEGDSRYLAPEAFERIGTHVDIFSLGITILEISTDLDLPSEGEVWHLLRQGELPTNLLSGKSAELCEVIQLMMAPDFTKRPSASEILALPYVTNVWRWRRPYVNYCQIAEMVRSCQILMWAFTTFFARNAASARAFLLLARGMKKTPPLNLNYSGLSANGWLNGELFNGQLKLDNTFSDDEYSRGGIENLSGIYQNGHSINDSFSTPPADLHEDAQIPEFCSSPDDIDFERPGAKYKLNKTASRTPWNSTPASESRMRRRIMDVNSPNDLKRMRGDQIGNGPKSPLRFNRILSHESSYSDSSVIGGAHTMPNIRYGRINDSSSIRDSLDSDTSRPIVAPKNLLDAFDADSEPEIEL